MVIEDGLCLEYRTHEVVKMRVNGVVAVITAVDIMPDVWYAVLREAVVVAIRRIINDFVIRACSDEQQGGSVFFAAPLEAASNTGSGADRTDITKEVRTLHADQERFSAAHRKACDRGVFSACQNRICLFDMRHEVGGEVVDEVEDYLGFWRRRVFLSFAFVDLD